MTALVVLYALGAGAASVIDRRVVAPGGSVQVTALVALLWPALALYFAWSWFAARAADWYAHGGGVDAPLRAAALGYLGTLDHWRNFDARPAEVLGAERVLRRAVHGAPDRDARPARGLPSRVASTGAPC